MSGSSQPVDNKKQQSEAGDGAQKQQGVEDLPTTVFQPAKPPVRELRVKVWDEEESSESAPARSAASSLQDPLPDEGQVEDLPTRLLESYPPVPAIPNELDVDAQPTRPLLAESPARPLSMKQGNIKQNESISQLNTVQMPAAEKIAPRFEPKLADKAAFTVVRDNTPAPSQSPERRSGSESTQQVTPLPPVAQTFRPAAPLPPVPETPRPVNPLPLVPVTPPVQLRSGHQYGQQPAGGAVAPSSHVPTQKKRKSRVPLVVAIVLIVLLIAAGIGSWVVVARPFAVNPTTDPVQQFQDASLHVSLLYPKDWSAQVHHDKGTVLLADSDTIDQFTISVDATASDPAQYLQSQAKLLTITDAKADAPVSFGGSTWQQIHGTLQLNGVKYQALMLATVYNSRLYMITQLAPGDSFDDEVKFVFTPMHSSWQFI
ncbi:hypothetical protein KTT_21520 [Tengunoibacter tsumagoiensis]|uniref:Uncharacterized protein n=2 Tax=Tengunoibacter tsumagoiensis TaxID=2014871 RepID=A0A401ZZM4_9CHLR|nr:hypothetical protein KTT_21520 [Tengunoibacter tsumagoiensis]